MTTFYVTCEFHNEPSSKLQHISPTQIYQWNYLSAYRSDIWLLNLNQLLHPTRSSCAHKRAPHHSFSAPFLNPHLVLSSDFLICSNPKNVWINSELEFYICYCSPQLHKLLLMHLNRSPLQTQIYLLIKNCCYDYYCLSPL